MDDIRDMVESAEYENRTYIRGVHQALTYAYRMAMRAKTLEEAREVIGLMEDEAAESRGSGNFSYTVLDDIVRAAYRKCREKSKTAESE